MMIQMLHTKIHRATVRQTDLDYVGSITIDQDLLDAAGILVHEQVDVLNITNGNRFTTYAISGQRGSGIIGINGAAAHLTDMGDLVIICAYRSYTAEQAKQHTPTVIIVDEHNTISH